MYSFKVPFVFLATTFVTAVLATPLYVPIRRDSDDAVVTNLTSLFTAASSSAQHLTSDIQGLSSTSNQGETQNVFDDFTAVAQNMDVISSTLTALGHLTDGDGQSLVTNVAIPFFDNLNDIPTALNEQDSVLHDLSHSPSTFNFPSDIQSSLQKIVVSFGSMVAAIPTAFSGDAQEQLGLILTDIVTNLNTTTTVIESL